MSNLRSYNKYASTTHYSYDLWVCAAQTYVSNNLDVVLVKITFYSSTQLRSSQHYTDSDKSIQMAGHHNMTAAHATLAVDVSYFSIQLFCVQVVMPM